jgi:hypothetical protein
MASVMTVGFIVLMVGAATPAQASPEPKVLYSVGQDKVAQDFQEASGCRLTPCLVNKYAAIRLQHD